VLDVREHHDPQRRLLQVRELRDDERLRLKADSSPRERNQKAGPRVRLLCLGPPVGGSTSAIEGRGLCTPALPVGDSSGEGNTPRDFFLPIRCTQELRAMTKPPRTIL